MAAKQEPTTPGGADSFVHQVAIEVSYPLCQFVGTLANNQMSRMMNMVNPNDILAQRVIDIAKHNRSGEAFINGESLFRRAQTNI